MRIHVERPDYSSYPMMTVDEVHRNYPDSFVLLVDIEDDPVTRRTVRGRVRAVARSRKDLPCEGIRGYFTTVFTGKWEVDQLPTLLWRLGGRR